MIMVLLHQKQAQTVLVAAVAVIAKTLRQVREVPVLSLSGSRLSLVALH
ncbi:MAG: hypothetical protein OIF34_12505 [Porticoccaceae bacterium]|nr:hypothetical protein [Porticoccaceae bacterium]